MKKRQPHFGDGEAGKPIHLAPMDTVLFKQFLPVLAHCAVNRYDDGTPRAPGYLIIRTDGAQWKMILKEPDVGLQLSLSAATFDDLFALACLFLEVDTAPWESDPYAKGNGKPRKK